MSSATPLDVGVIDGVSGIDGGADHTCAWAHDGRTWSWGRNHVGQLGDGSDAGERREPVELEQPVRVVGMSAGLLHTCARDDEGRVSCWGSSELGQLGPEGDEATAAVPLPEPALEVAAGARHTCALLESGDVWCWGLWSTTSFEVSPEPQPLDIPPARTIDAGGNHTCAWTRDGELLCWVLDAPLEPAHVSI